MHAVPNNPSCKANSKERVKNNSNKSSEDGVQIPCDICDFTSVSAGDFINHISFKKHLELPHKWNVGGWSTVNSSKSKKLCIYWNQGHCSYNRDCKFEHKEIAACLFKERCSRPD